MKKHFWSDSELYLLEEWDWVSRYAQTQLPHYITDSENIRKTFLEANLLIINKLVIVYEKFEQQPSEIMSFREFLMLQENYLESGRELFYHPINFQSLLEFNYFLFQKREDIFTHSN